MFCKFTGKHLFWLKASNFINKRLQDKCLLFNFVKSLRTPILVKYCERLILDIRVLKNRLCHNIFLRNLQNFTKVIYALGLFVALPNIFTELIFVNYTAWKVSVFEVFWFVFFHIRTEYENTDQKNSEYEHFSRMLFFQGSSIINVLKNFAKFTRRRLSQSLNKVVNSCKFCKIFKNIFLCRTPPVAVSDTSVIFVVVFVSLQYEEISKLESVLVTDFRLEMCLFI